MDAGSVLLAMCCVGPLAWFFAKDVWDRVHEEHGPPEG